MLNIELTQYELVIIDWGKFFWSLSFPADDIWWTGLRRFLTKKRADIKTKFHKKITSKIKL